ncbi:adenylate/guanylate cyclase domain-containing protein [Nordella sp. HKS 07]|uniref:adenylate/guanylate cyclase domain-containing protein n=1 Tax=Nordella sp. HKS 07 TaxID=2712222 RepID=UPI0013E1488A|nr:adenylate/guanylate cyclase domain-containing protein [Nordella sp. HKS 07]QIG46611.1 adenylate/guanylate cyclase domain-containing protein [Nordella sp. HKS 07]
MIANRRLVAILVADVVGYSRLMEADESGTLAALLDWQKAILEVVLRRHDGRLVKLMGDGVLVEFGSAVNAVAAALELQGKMAEANENVAGDRQIVLRIGINLGDVLDEGEDIYGDGVNIAARLETLSEPGGVVISRAVHEQVRGKIDATLDDLGEHSLKNIAKPVRVFRVSAGKSAAPSLGARPSSSERPTIAVLPFFNMSRDPEQDYFSDGITEDIITELSRFHELSVVARNTSFQYRGKAVDVKRVGQALRAQYVVEGSVRKFGSYTRITAQLIDTESGNHLWAERFDRDQEDIFVVLDQVISSLVGTLVGRLEAMGAGQGKRQSTSMRAYDFFLRGLALPAGDIAAEREARILFEKAIELDPRFGRAYAMIAYLLAQDWFREPADSKATLEQALEVAKTAVRLDDTNGHSHQILSWVYLNLRELESAEHHYRRAMELNPNSAANLTGMGDLHIFWSRTQEGFEWYRRAKIVDPHFNPAWWWRMIGVAHFNARQYDEAVTAFSRAPALPAWAHAYVAACHAYGVRNEKAHASAAEVLRLFPEFSARRLADKEAYKLPNDREHLLAGLLKAGLPE